MQKGSGIEAQQIKLSLAVLASPEYQLETCLLHFQFTFLLLCLQRQLMMTQVFDTHVGD